MALLGLAFSDTSVLSGIFPSLADGANRFGCAVLLVLPPLGQADILPFVKNLSRAASPTPPLPCPKGRWQPPLFNPVITLALFLFRIIRFFFLMLLVWFFALL